MLKSVTVTNHLGESVKMELGFPEKSGFLIRSIDGIGPEKATINITDLASIDGGLYSGSHIGPRNISLVIELLENPTIEHTRHFLYGYFPTKKFITLDIETDLRNLKISGYVESNSIEIFSKNEFAVISLLCPDPYFYSSEVNVTYLSAVVSVFQLPFSNESLTENLIIFSSLEIKDEKTVFYEGDVPTGVVIRLHSTGIVTNPKIYNTRTRETMEIDTVKLAALTGSGLVNGDDITITTIKGKKSIILTRNGVNTNIINCLNKDADWFQIEKGDNIFAYTVGSGATNLQVLVENQILYEGI